MENTTTPTRTAYVRSLESICLRVRDSIRAAAFYIEFIGFEPDGSDELGERLVLRDLDGRPILRLALAEGLPPGTMLTGLDHFSLEVEDPAEVDRIRLEALKYFIPVTRPRALPGRRRVFVFDPDGYKVEVFARLGEDAEIDEAADGSF